MSTAIESIAVIGLACRMPRAADAEEFWARLRDGVDCIRDFSRDELLGAGSPAALLDRPNFVGARGALDGIDLFDAAFFGFTPHEAAITDPQHRLFLECAWEAVEDAGYDTERYDGRIGVFGSTSMNGYVGNLLQNPKVAPHLSPVQLLVSSDKDHLCTRASYKLNLRGPGVTVQTACSSSLVAVCYACDSLNTRQCDMALAGAVSATHCQVAGYVYEEGGVASPDGRCRAFDRRSRGTVAGSGVALVMLKRLSEALADGDTIRAVIRGWAVNNDGSSKVGYTAPSVQGQAEVIGEAQALADTPADTISYVEAHGTGTPIGDPIEIEALTRAFRLSTSRRSFCAIGSVKTNIGHLDVAAGVAGLVKTVLALEHGAIPPSLHFEEPNPELHLEDTPFFVNGALRPWVRNGTPRRAGVSSFGLGGTNAHVVLEEAPPQIASDHHPRTHVLCLSARTAPALERVSIGLADYLRQHRSIPLADAAFTLATGRRQFAHRRAVLCRDVEEAVRLCSAPASHHGAAGVVGGRRPRVAFAFPGQGAQRVGMASGLYEHEPVMREELDRCAEGVRPQLGLDVRSLLLGSTDEPNDAQRRLDETWLAQPCLFAMSYAMACLLMRWGIQPVALIGHSVGEYVAATLAGVMSLPDALRVIAERGRFMQARPPGAMLAIKASPDAIAPLLSADLEIGAFNAPRECVVSGPIDHVGAFEGALRSQGIESVRLRTSHAFHSRMMQPAADALLETMSDVLLVPPRLRIASTVTGQWADARDLTAARYWARGVSDPVRFAPALDQVLAVTDVIVEVGPGRALTNLALRAGRSGISALACLPDPGDADAAERSTAELLARLWVAGVPVDWPSRHGGETRRRVPLPTYPFERARHWVSAGEPTSVPLTADPAPIQAGLPVRLPVWKQSWPATGSDRAGDWDWPWVVIAGRSTLACELGRMAREENRRVVILRDAASLRRTREDEYELDLADERQLVTVLDELWAGAPSHSTSWRVVHAAALATPDELAGPALDEATRTFWTLVYIARAAAAAPALAAASLDVLTHGTYRVSGDEQLEPAWAVLSGPARVTPQEYPHVAARLIDVWLRGEMPSTDACLRSVLGELLSPAREPVVALRHGIRFVPAREPKPAARRSRAVLPAGGTYVITGGCGGIGLALAEQLVRHLRANVALITRRQPPPRDAWQDIVARSAPGDEHADVARGLLRISEAGGDPLVLVADVSDRAAMAAALDAVRQRFGRIDVALHAAGIAGGGVLATLDPQIVRRTWAPKVAGALILDELLSEDGSTIVLFSSDRVLLGGPGRCDYVAANAFMDAFAVMRGASAPSRVVSINWGTWGDVGMAVRAARTHTRSESAERPGGLTTADGLAAIESAITAGASQVAISYELLGDPGASSQATTKGLPAPAPLAGAPRPEPAPAALRPAPASDLEHLLSLIWQEVLGIERVGLEDDFFELGGDSVIGLRIAARAREHGVRLKPTDLFKWPTIRALAAQHAPAPGGLASAPLLPTQRWWLEQERGPGPATWTWLDVTRSLTASHLRAVATRCAARLDVLRVRLRRGPDGWRQVDTRTPSCLAALVDLAALDGSDRDRARVRSCEHIGTVASVEDGPAMALVGFNGGTEDHRLLLVTHPLLLDDWSLHRIAGHVVEACESDVGDVDVADHASANPASLDAASMLSEQGNAPARSHRGVTGSDRGVERHAAVAIDYSGTMDCVSVRIESDGTAQMFRALGQRAELHAGDAALWAVLSSLHELCGPDAARVDVEYDLRELLGPPHALSRALGCFTAIAPIEMPRVESSEMVQGIFALHDALRGAVRQALAAAYGPPRRGDGESWSPSAAGFAWVAREADDATSSHAGTALTTSGSRQPRWWTAHRLHVSAAHDDHGLTFNWYYRPDVDARARVQQAADRSLESLYRLASAPDLESRAPGDFPDAALNTRDVRAVVTRVLGTSG